MRPGQRKERDRGRCAFPFRSSSRVRAISLSLSLSQQMILPSSNSLFFVAALTLFVGLYFFYKCSVQYPRLDAMHITCWSRFCCTRRAVCCSPAQQDTTEKSTEHIDRCMAFVGTSLVVFVIAFYIFWAMTTAHALTCTRSLDPAAPGDFTNVLMARESLFPYPTIYSIPVPTLELPLRVLCALTYDSLNISFHQGEHAAYESMLRYTTWNPTSDTLSFMLPSKSISVLIKRYCPGIVWECILNVNVQQQQRQRLKRVTDDNGRPFPSLSPGLSTIIDARVSTRPPTSLPALFLAMVIIALVLLVMMMACWFSFAAALFCCRLFVACCARLCPMRACCHFSLRNHDFLAPALPVHPFGGHERNPSLPWPSVPNR